MKRASLMFALLISAVTVASADCTDEFVHVIRQCECSSTYQSFNVCGGMLGGSLCQDFAGAPIWCPGGQCGFVPAGICRINPARLTMPNDPLVPAREFLASIKRPTGRCAMSGADLQRWIDESLRRQWNKKA